MKKLICILISLSLLLSLLAGCGLGEQGPDSGSHSGQSDIGAGTTAGTTAGTAAGTLGTGEQTVVMTRGESSGEASTASSPELPGTNPPPQSLEPQTSAPQSSEDTTALTALPMQGNIETVNGVLTVDAWAMEYCYTSTSGLQSYADKINSLKSYLPNVNFFAMFIPTAIAFYCPEGINGGSDQRAAMESWYGMMPGVAGVDTFSALDQHKQEYLYFRTDTHWTQRGGYYAYTAFCDAAGFAPHSIGEYEYASSTGYLGYMYTILKDTGVGTAMNSNPDTVEKFKPVSDLTAVSYSDPSMSGSGMEIPLVSMSSGSYYAFTQGDQPLIHIKNSSVSNGRIAIITKDSYGNTVVPFISDCFEEVYVIDQRHFNTDSTYSLNIVSFAQTHGVTDIIVEANAFNASNSASTFGKMLP